MAERPKLKLGILISGRGSNMRALMEACADTDFPADIAVVLSNRADAPGLKAAQDAGVACQVIDHSAFETREEFEHEIQTALTDAGVQLVCLAGFMRLLTSGFVSRWRDRMINIHPSLLPAYKGLHTHDRAIEDGVRFSGCTVHFVRPEMDTGPIIAQAAVPVLPDDTAKVLSRRVLGVEHQLYVEVVRLIALGRVRVSGNKVIITGHEAPGPAMINPMIR